MDKKSRKQLINEYKNRKPEMGIISIKNNSTKERFLDISKSIQADLNSHRFKLKANWHPNHRIQVLWNEHSEADFEFSVIKELEYEDSTVDYTEKLEAILMECLEANHYASRLNKE